MKKLYIILYISILSVFFASAQDFPLHTQYMYNKAAINPGATGIMGKVSLLVMHRSQWLKIDGAPTTSNLSFQYPLKKAAFGLDVMYDQAGPITKTMGTLQFSYNLELSYSTFLSLGLNAGIYSNKFDIDKLLIKDVDEDLFQNNINTIDFNVGIGALLYSETWFVGLSVPNLNMQKYYSGLQSQLDKKIFQAYFLSGYNFEVSRRSTLQPSVLVRYANGLPISADFSLNMHWNETLITGLAYRLNAAYSLLLGINVSRQFQIGYSFDLDQSKIYKSNFGSHEVFLRYFLTKDENSLRYQSPRFF